MDPQLMALIQALMQQKQGGGMEMEVGAADAMGPEGLAQHMALGSIEDRKGLNREAAGMGREDLHGQLAQAQKLQSQRFGNSGSAAGNYAGGIGDVLNSLRGGIMENRARGGLAEALQNYDASQTGLLNRQDTGRADYANARIAAMRKLMAAQQQPAAPAPMPLEEETEDDGLSFLSSNKKRSANFGLGGL